LCVCVCVCVFCVFVCACVRVCVCVCDFFLQEKHIEDTRPYTNTPILEEAGSVTQQIDELVSFVQSQVHWLIVKRRLEGGINVSAPEVSRIWQV